jgi:hypothetical protein
MRPFASNSPAARSPHADDSAEGGALQNLCLFFHQGEAAVPHDLLLDQRTRVGHAMRSLQSIAIEPSPSIQTSKASLTKVAASSSTIIAGPARRDPGNKLLAPVAWDPHVAFRPAVE